MRLGIVHYLFLTTIIVMSTLIFGISAASSSNDGTSFDDVKKETNELLSTLKGYSVEQKDNAVAKTKSALKNIDHRIDALEARVDKDWDEMNNATRDQARESLKSLRKQRTKVAEWFGSMRSSSGEGWKHMKDGFSNAYQALADSWEKAEEEFETKNK